MGFVVDDPMSPLHPPVVLAIAGHDPSGGAGIQADIEAAGANGALVATVVSCLTVQDTRNVHSLSPLEPQLVLAQAETLLRDLPVAAIKIGLIGTAELAQALVRLLDREASGIPVVLDPILRAGGGSALADTALRAALRDALIPRATLVTPNLPEARMLGGAQTAEECAQRLLRLGTPWVLVTGTHEDAPVVTNRLFGPAGRGGAWDWPRLPHSYHGSGCTLASAAAALLARGLPMEQAVERAQDYTWRALAAGYRPGQGQHLPERLLGLRGEPQ
jgi:hydroxymethylpyrimidine/phosphomethylpyrimidine kinase